MTLPRILRRLDRRTFVGAAKRLGVFALLTVAAFYGFCTLGLLYVRSYPPPTTAVRIERRIDASLARRPYTVRSRWVPLAQIPQSLQHAVIAAEDGGFYGHRGVDWEELRMAIDDWRTEGKPLRGASTLTQQLVKNLFLSTRRSHVRKLVEWTLAPWAERILSKERILEIYLNIVEWGPGVWGAAAAVDFHYGAPLDSLSRGQAARLAACLPAPRSRTPDRMNQYSAVILARMAARGW